MDIHGNVVTEPGAGQHFRTPSRSSARCCRPPRSGGATVPPDCSSSSFSRRFLLQRGSFHRGTGDPSLGRGNTCMHTATGCTSSLVEDENLASVEFGQIEILKAQRHTLQGLPKCVRTFVPFHFRGLLYDSSFLNQ